HVFDFSIPNELRRLFGHWDCTIELLTNVRLRISSWDDIYRIEARQNKYRSIRADRSAINSDI
ncbi:hypothetical protein CHS0354_024322, partial [Potamilus streckersoni]